MTQRLYYDDPYRTHFTARVVERFQWQGRPAVVLDRSAFYPTSGGQPHDTGWLNGVPVLDVVEAEDTGQVIHVLEALLETGDAEGRIDWDRRFDHMQQHSGQHILSAAALALLGAGTVGFHLSEEYATIDLDRAPLSSEDLSRAEALANSVVFENRPALSRFVTDEELPGLPLRKPVSHSGPVRIVQIGDFDCSACGGTHVRASGEIGLIKVTRADRRGVETRVEFVCGRRALRDYGTKNALLTGLAAEYTVGYWEVPDMVHRLAEDLQQTRRELRQARDQFLEAEAMALWHQAESLGGVRLVRAHLPGSSPDDLKHLAQRLIVHPWIVVLLGAGQEAGGKGHLVFARSSEVEVHMGNLLRQACETVGGRGGGRPEFAQGGGPDGSKVPLALDASSHALAALLAAAPGT
jgi:alanyl-tRNA synthetase